MSTKPKLHILIPTYNRKLLIARTLDQLLGGQTIREGWLLTVIDNCSNDGTKEVLESYRHRYGHFNYLCNDRNIGLFQNINRCMDAAETCHFMIVHSDDFISPRLVAVALEAIVALPSAGMIFGPCRAYLEESDELIESWHSSSMIAKHRHALDGRLLFSALLASGSNFIFPPSVIYNNDLFRDGFRYSLEYNYSSDYELWLEVSSHNPVIGYYDEPVITCNIGMDRLSYHHSQEMRAEYIQISHKFLAKAFATMSLHLLTVRSLRLIYIRLILYSILNRLELFPSFKVRRRLSKILERITI